MEDGQLWAERQPEWVSYGAVRIFFCNFFLAFTVYLNFSFFFSFFNFLFFSVGLPKSLTAVDPPPGLDPETEAGKEA